MNNNTNKEIWKEISGYDGVYYVSNKGNVKSVDRYVNYGDKGKRFSKGRVLKKSYNENNGYYSVALYKDGKSKRKYVHRLVAKHFVRNENNKPEVNHKDEVKTNNSYDNLEWVTRLENNIYNGRSKRISKKSTETKTRLGIHKKAALKRSKKVKGHDPVTGLVTEYQSITEAAERNPGFDRANISRAAHGKQRHAHGVEWELI